MSSFEPRLDMLPAAQRRFWPELGSLAGRFVLYGGTAVALWLGHRVSVDFDFMTEHAFDPHELAESLPLLARATIVQSAPSTLTAIVERGGPIKLSFFGVPTLGRVHAPTTTSDGVLRVAGLLDLAGTKAMTVQRRAEAKDYVDLDAILGQDAFGLDAALAATRVIYGPRANLQLSLKALVHFEDGDLPSLPTELRMRLVRAVDAVDLSRLPPLQPERAHREGDR